MSIKYTTSCVNNVFTVNFDCSPWDVGKHKAAGTKRLDIWEGTKVTETWYRIDGGAWKSNGSKTKFSVTANKNGVKIEAKARLEVWTMGKPGASMPAFHYGKYEGGVMKYKDTNEKWTQNMAQKPTVLRQDWKTITELDDTWKLKHLDWYAPGSSISAGNWTYKHTLALRSGYKYKTEWKYGAEYRNGNHGTNSAAVKYGWKSVQGNYPQEYRKNQYFIFYKDFTSSAVTSSGISTVTGTPTIYAPYSIGDTGKVTVTYKDPNNVKGTMWVRAECDGKSLDLCTYSNSDTFSNNGSKTFNVNFASVFGQSYRGKDVKYYARIKNNYGSQSSQVSAGPQRFNALPTVPTNPAISVDSKTLSMTWSASSDVDKDAISYCVYPYAYVNGSWVQQKNASGKDSGYWTTSTSYYYNVASFAEGTKFKFRVWAWDGRLYSYDCAESETTSKAYNVKTAQFLYPKSSVISKRPRIVLSIPETPDNAAVTTHIKWNGTWYSNVSHPSYFSVTGSSTKYTHKQVFMPPSDFNGSTAIEFKTSNNASTSSTTSKTITHKSSIPEVLAQKGELITTDHIELILPCIKAQANAYGVAHGISDSNIPSPGMMIDNEHINQLFDSIATVNNGINGYGYKVSYGPTTIKNNDSILADKVNSIISDLKRI